MTNPNSEPETPSASEPPSEQASGLPRGKRQRTRIMITAACLLTVALAGGGVAAAVVVSGDTSPKQEKNVDMVTASVQRGNLTGSTSASGTLAYAGPRSFSAGTGGVVTALPIAGAKIGLGQQLFAVDNSPSFLFFGPLPAWRSFESAMEAGPDVKALEEGLKALGFFTKSPDAEFDWWTTQAILNWQKATGQKRSGTIALGTVLISPGEVRISAVSATVGDQVGAGTAMLKVTELRKLVNVNLKLADQTLGTVDAKVDIDLPGGKSVAGRVSSVGVPTEQEANGKKDVVIPVVIEPEDPAAAGDLQQASVTVRFSTEKRENVLSVPVEALLALDPGTFGVEVVQANGTTRKIPVKTGLFAAGQVEISASEITEGQKVVVPRI